MAGNPGRARVAAVVAVLCALAGCAAPAPHGRYTGASPACPGGGGAAATLVRNGTAFALAPADGAIIVHGTIAADGALAGSLVLHPGHVGAPGPVPAPAPAKPRAAEGLTLTVTGHIDEGTAVLDYAAGTCRATLTLARVQVPLL